MGTISGMIADRSTSIRGPAAPTTWLPTWIFDGMVDCC
jgi:hypothetical protein